MARKKADWGMQLGKRKGRGEREREGEGEWERERVIWSEGRENGREESEGDREGIKRWRERHGEIWSNREKEGGRR